MKKVGKIITLILIGANIVFVLVLYWLALREGDPFTSEDFPLLATLGTVIGSTMMFREILKKIWGYSGFLLPIIMQAVLFFLGINYVMVPAIISTILCVLCIIVCIIGLMKKNHSDIYY